MDGIRSFLKEQLLFFQSLKQDAGAKSSLGLKYIGLGSFHKLRKHVFGVL